MQNSEQKDFFNDNIKKTSLTFRLLNRVGILNNIQRDGNISFWGFLRYLISDTYKRFLFSYSVKGYFLESLNKKKIRPRIWKRLGCKIGKNVHIGHNVVPDFGYSEHITIGNNVVISNGVSILCHKRDVTEYKRGGMATHLPFICKDVIIEDGCQIGINCTILPGVVIGEGSIIGSCSLVTKSIPAWSIAVGSPAKVIKTLE